MSGARVLSVALMLVVSVAAVLIVSLFVWRTEGPVAVPSPTATGAVAPSATLTSGSAAPTTIVAPPCPNRYLPGDAPIVAPRKSGQSLEVALDAVRPGQNGHNRWMIRFYLPTSAPGSALIPLEAAVVGTSGPLQVFGYDAGPPNAGSAPATASITLQPCGTVPATFATGLVVLGVETSAVASGTYTLTWRGIRRPEGDAASETFTVALTCSVAPGAPGATPATECK